MTTCRKQDGCFFSQSCSIWQKKKKKTVHNRQLSLYRMWTVISFLKSFSTAHFNFKGSVERSLLPWAIFLIFTQTGLESLKITSACCFLLKCQRKDSKKAKEHRQFRGVLGRWRTAAIDRTTFHACQRCRKTAVFAVSSRIWGVIWRVKAFRDQQCQFLTRNKSLSSENESNCSMTSECVRTDLILPRGAGLEHGRCKQSFFSLSYFRHFGQTA